MQVSVILINWNQSPTTVRCIESLFQQTERTTHFSFNVIIVDNHSDEESLFTLEKYLENTPYKEIHLIRNSKNLGFSGGNNTGIRFALENKQPNYIWLLNNDIIVQADALNKLVSAATQHPQIKIWASTIYEVQPYLHFHCAGGFSYNPWLSIPTPITFPPEQLAGGLYFPMKNLDYPAGASMFVKSEVFLETGLMNEAYFLYYEELDLVHQIGGKSHLAWCPDSILHHQSGQSTGSKNPNKGQGSWIAHYYGNLSALKYTWLYHKQYFPIVFLFRISAKSVLFVKHRDFKSFQPLLKAYHDFFKWLFSPT